jgi:hypothetical protein
MNIRKELNAKEFQEYSGCTRCDLGYERFKMKRNYIHYFKYRCFVCTNKNLLTYQIGKKSQADIELDEIDWYANQKNNAGIA